MGPWGQIHIPFSETSALFAEPSCQSTGRLTRKEHRIQLHNSKKNKGCQQSNKCMERSSTIVIWEAIEDYNDII